MFSAVFRVCSVTVSSLVVLDGSPPNNENCPAPAEASSFGVAFSSLLFSVVSVEVALYSILTYIIAAKVTDTVIEGFEDFIGVTIVSKKYDLIKVAILEELGTGLTVYKGSSGFGSKGEAEDFDIIHSIINRIDIKKMHRLIKEIDPEAFIVEFDVNSVKGGVLRHYIDKKKNKNLELFKTSVSKNKD